MVAKNISISASKERDDMYIPYQIRGPWISLKIPGVLVRWWYVDAPRRTSGGTSWTQSDGSHRRGSQPRTKQYHWLRNDAGAVRRCHVDLLKLQVAFVNHIGRVG